VACVAVIVVASFLVYYISFMFSDYRLNSPSTSAISLEVMGHRLHIAQVRGTGEAPEGSCFTA
jgi:hypothetical protein